MSTQGLRIVFRLSDVLNNREVLNNLNLSFFDLERIRTIRDGTGTDDRLTQSDLITLSGLNFDLEKESLGIYNEITTYPSLLSNLTNVRANINFDLDLNGRFISPSFKFKNINFDDNIVSTVDFSTSRRSAWSSFGDPEESVFYGGDLKLTGNTFINFSSIDLQSPIIEKRFDSQIPTHKVRVTINGEEYDLFAMKGIPVIFRGFFRSGLIRYVYNVLPNGQSPSVVIKTVSNNEEIVYNLVNSSDLVSDTSQFINSTISQERDIEFYYPSDNLIELYYNNLEITDLPKIIFSNLEVLSLSRNKLIDFPDFKTLTPALLELDVSNSVDLTLSSNIQLRSFSQEIVRRLPRTLRVLDISEIFNNTETTADFGEIIELPDLTTEEILPNLKELYASGSTTRNMIGTAPRINSGLEVYDIRNNRFNALPDSVTLSSSLKTIKISDNRILGSLSFPNLSNILIEFISGDGNQHQIVNVAGFSELKTYASGNMEFVGTSSVTNIFENCTSLETIQLNESTASGTMPNFSTNTSLKEFEAISTNINAATIDFLLSENTFGPEQGGCRATLEKFAYNKTLQLDEQLPPIHPLAFKNMSSLKTLQIFRMQPMGGDLPNFDDLVNIEQLELYINDHTGFVPAFTNNTKLKIIKLDNNLLTGSVPNLTLPNLQLLQLNFNNLQGFGEINCPNLIAFNAEGNQLSELPDVKNLFICQSLTFQNNQISSYTPGTLIDLGSLFVLNLQDNNLSTSDINNILEDLNTNYDLYPRNNVTIILKGNSPPSPTQRIQAIIAKLSGEPSWQISID